VLPAQMSWAADVTSGGNEACRTIRTIRYMRHQAAMSLLSIL
jgi:hypothetical protein